VIDLLALITLGLLLTSIVLTFKKNNNKSVFWVATIVAIIGFGYVSDSETTTSIATKTTINDLTEYNTEKQKELVEKNKKLIEMGADPIIESPMSILKNNIEKTIDRSIKIEESFDKSCIMIRFPMNDLQWSVDGIIKKGQKDIVLILAEYRNMPLNKNAAVCITGTLTSIDAYGREDKDSAAMMVAVEYETLQKMNFSTFQFKPHLLDNHDLYGYSLMSWVKD
jgi:hypothetical protein